MPRYYDREKTPPPKKWIRGVLAERAAKRRIAGASDKVAAVEAWLRVSVVMALGTLAHCRAHALSAHVRTHLHVRVHTAQPLAAVAWVLA